MNDFGLIIPRSENIVSEYTKLKDGHPLWPKHVDAQVLKLKKRLGYD